MKEDDGKRKKGKEGRKGAVVEAVTVGVLINKSQLDTPSWFDTPFSILISEDVGGLVGCAVLSAPGLGSALVKISYYPLDVGQLVVQVLTALFLLVVVGAVLFKNQTNVHIISDFSYQPDHNSCCI